MRSLTLGNRLKVFENVLLMKIPGPKRNEVTGYWRRLHHALYGMYAAPNIVLVIKSRRMTRMGHVAWRKKPLGRPRCRWEDNDPWIIKK
jgi:hypothetical protein